jgi:hypothetical protein
MDRPPPRAAKLSAIDANSLGLSQQEQRFTREDCVLENNVVKKRTVGPIYSASPFTRATRRMGMPLLYVI